MDVSHILNPLNDAQREAVAAPKGSFLVLAGAGSGKTRVLVHRIAWLVETGNISPYSILAVTFTNKAAAEMKTRIENLLSMPVRGMWVGTFHGIAHRLLRIHWQEAGLPQNFQILDADDQLRLVRRIIKGLDLDEKKWPARQAMWFINSQKDEGLRSRHIEDYGDLNIKTNLEIYRAYEEACNRGGMIDFAELLLRAHELWLNDPVLLAHYQQRFNYILVDEFQDTNTIQYAWLRILAQDNLMVVGDDDQSIYGWRGAKIENIQQFTEDFPDSRTVRLEQNYRSTGNILKAANSLISKNVSRLGKELWTEDGDGDLISVYSGFNEMDEAKFIVDRIVQWSQSGNLRQESAILYRSNAQSRVLEEALLRANLPYRIYGGHRFFERAEIRNALAYMRLISNRHADAAFERVVNTPSRGIGDRTVQQIRDFAKRHDMSLWAASEKLIEQDELTARTVNAMRGFRDLINELDGLTEDKDLPNLCELVITRSGLLDYYKKEKGETGQARVENLEELVTAARQFDPNADASFDAPEDEDSEFYTLLDEFLNHAALEAGENQGEENEDCVQLMTLHSAKGLEFPLVFIAGVEEGLFPHRMSLDEPGRLEEERRLCYVGMTRAMQQLYLTYAETRRLHGKETYNRPSRFVKELPPELLQEIRIRTSRSKPVTSSGQSTWRSNAEVPNTGMQLGQRVRHKKFGEGVVTNYEGQGKQARIQINFDGVGDKWLVTGLANLELVA
ncbi:MAG: DNA helicase II [Gammaproteobacteria bacterium]|nr:DNA helicase II [Gammaproteobacteria bacterium]